MIIVGLHSIHGIDSNTPEGAGAHPKEGGLRPTRHGGGGVGQLNSMSLTPARSTPVQLHLNDLQVSDGTPPDGTEGGDQEDKLVVYEVGIEVEPAEKFDLSDFVEDGNVRKIHNGGEDNVIVYDLERTEKGCYRAYMWILWIYSLLISMTRYVDI